MKSNHSEKPIQIFDADTMNAPWSVVTKLKTAVEAIRFFNPRNVVANKRMLGQEPDSDRLLSFKDFVLHLEKTGVFGERKPNLIRLIHILDAMTREGILQNVGSYSRGPRVFDDCFLFMFPASGNRERAAGQLWLAPVVGPELLFHAVGDAVVQITGHNSQGEERAGTGIVISEQTVLTARHVVDDLKLNEEQVFQAVDCIVTDDSIKTHPVEDVAFISVGEKLRPAKGLVLHPPTVGQRVFMLGYPRVPFVSTAPLVMHSGEVTTDLIQLFNGESAFLYSATTRPGNSGGPIISADGYLLGLASKDLTVKAEKDWFAPHYAGVDARILLKSASDLGLDIPLHFEAKE